MNDSESGTAGDGPILITRIFDSPRDRVFKAWTDPAEVAAWYGPAQMEVPPQSVRIDLRVGGRWELTMVPRGGDGEFPVGYEIVELVEPELLVMRSDPMPQMGMPDPIVLRLEFHDHGEKTRLTMTDGPYPAGGGGAEAGWNAALEELATLVG